MKTRLIRIERVHNSETVLLVDELDRFVAEVDSVDFSCDIWDGKAALEEDGEFWYRINMDKLKEYKR